MAASCGIRSFARLTTHAIPDMARVKSPLVDDVTVVAPPPQNVNSSQSTRYWFRDSDDPTPLQRHQK